MAGGAAVCPNWRLTPAGRAAHSSPGPAPSAGQKSPRITPPGAKSGCPQVRLASASSPVLINLLPQMGTCIKGDFVFQNLHF